ncbi:hypothetical protein [Xenorhabdus littoralis]|uniref:hypothetical protein n=1 Tax=Xenorhabdus littoralis TaxID=2582835 RepID=UPI0029E7D1AB|nr:hypothetical protein [Xenorhabdus sp. psl]MDX7993095.1 hypothetical protein [Xenorhabdus sp. psl]
MTVTIEIACRYCGQMEPVRKHGTGKAGFPRYYCKNCQKTQPNLFHAYEQVRFCYKNDKQFLS